MLKTVLKTAAVCGTVAFFMKLYKDNPEAFQTLFKEALPYGMALIGLKKGSLYFVLETSSLSSLQQLWTSYKDGSLKKKVKKVINEIDEVRKLTQGTEIDVTVEIDEDEYREACWALVLAKIEQDEKEARNAQRLLQRRHSLSCERDASHDKIKLSWQEWRALKEIGSKLENETGQRICGKQQPSEESRGQEMDVHKSDLDPKSEKEDMKATDDEPDRFMSKEITIEKLKKKIEQVKGELKYDVETDNKKMGIVYNRLGVLHYLLGKLYEEGSEKEDCEDILKKAENYFRKAADSWERLNAQELISGNEKSVIDHSLFITYQYLTTVLLANNQIEEALVVSDCTRDRDLGDTMIEKFHINPEILNESMRYANISSILENDRFTIMILIHAVKATNINVWTLDYEKPPFFLEKPARDETNLKTLLSTCITDIVEGSSHQEQLYELLIAPVLSNLTKDEIVIIADGLLKSVPFAALRDPQTGQFLSEMKCIRYAPSLMALKIWKECPVDYHVSTGALVVGDPHVGTVMLKGEEHNFLPSRFAQREAVVVSAILNASPLVGPQATKDEVLKRLQEPLAVIHIAAMGNEKGEIFLAPSAVTREVIPQESDYLLTVKEVQEIRIRAQLVVLSFDGSGRGEIMSGKVNSMARAFLAAGARAVVASLWGIDEVAKRNLMVTFYTHLKKGERASKSLQNAMEELREDGYEEPVYWASFFLIGDDVTISV